MFINVAIVSALAALTSAIPGAENTKTNYFTAIATHSGDHRIHLQQINASGQRFYLIKGTSTDCPQAREIDCSKYVNSTVFDSRSDGTLYLHVGVPGGQQVYIASGGALVYTAPHSAKIPDDGQAATFTHTRPTSSGGLGTLVFDNKGFVACPVKVGHYYAYQLYAWIPKFNGTFRTDCDGFGFATSAYSGHPAWEFS